MFPFCNLLKVHYYIALVNGMFLHRRTGSTETQFLRLNWKVVADRVGTNVRK
jgi:hypothetical protein